MGEGLVMRSRTALFVVAALVVAAAVLIQAGVVLLARLVLPDSWLMVSLASAILGAAASGVTLYDFVCDVREFEAAEALAAVPSPDPEA